ncbi:Enzymatic polyprotein [Cucumis melo var. makuwa]|uniref:Enzymatic polyprotein n=1 Tax=Cucumis melo var. makuwa TaxID=1194695 RepID=A0A5A7SUR9_CUCMM|nr:Enzymatic polyprotein [Cucumis melo var. makuwa]
MTANSVNQQINWANLTYGDISSTVQMICVNLCTENKHTTKVIKDSDYSKELGTFCKQYGLSQGPKEEKKKKKKRYSSKNFFRKGKVKDQESPQRRRHHYYKDKGKKKYSSKTNTICFKCNQKGHYANCCPLKDKINALTIDEETKQSLLYAIRTDDDTSSQTESSSEEDYINILQEEGSSSEEKFYSQSDSSDDEGAIPCTGRCAGKCSGHINVITKDQETLFDLIELIPDEEAKRTCLLKLKQSLEEQVPQKTIQNPIMYSYQDILNRVKGEAKIPIQVEDLHHEEQIKTLYKKDLSLLEATNSIEDSKLPEATRKGSLLESPKCLLGSKEAYGNIAYEDGFKEAQIPTKARPIQMNKDLVKVCKDEITDLLNKGLISPSKSPWSCSAFYINNQAEKERGVPRLVINYKPLNKVLKWIRYPIPNRQDLLKRITLAKVFSKFDMKSGFWQIQIHPSDRYKTAFNVPFGPFQWNVMPFGLKNAPSEFQKIMNDIFNQYQEFTIVYIDDVLVFSNTVDQHFKHLRVFLNVIKSNGLVVSQPKIKLFQTKIRFLGYEINQGIIKPIQRSLEFVDKFPDVIQDKTQLQRFLGCVNYIGDFIRDLRSICLPLYDRLKKNPKPWTDEHTRAVQSIKSLAKSIPCLSLVDEQAKLIIDTDASDIGYGGILKQELNGKISIVRYHSGIRNSAQRNYSTIKKEVLAIVLSVQKFQGDLINKEFLVRTD